MPHGKEMERIFYLCLPPHTILLKVVTSLGTTYSFYQLWYMATTKMAFYNSSTYQCVSNQTDPENASKR